MTWFAEEAAGWSGYDKTNPTSTELPFRELTTIECSGREKKDSNHSLEMARRRW